MTTSGVHNIAYGTTIPTPANGQTAVGSSASGVLTTTDSNGNQRDLLNTADLGSAMALHMAIPSLRGFWPMSSIYGGSAYSVESVGLSRSLTYSSSYTYGITAGLIPYVTLTAASSHYLYRASEAALQANTPSGQQVGWTWGGWFNFATLPTGTNYMGLIGKWTSVLATDEYALYIQASGGVQYTSAYVSNGSVEPRAYVTSVSATGTWYHIVGRWVASTSVDIFVNGVKTSNTVSIPASLSGAAGQFQIGAFNSANFFNGSTTLDFVAGYPLSDAHIQLLYNRTRYLFP